MLYTRTRTRAYPPRVMPEENDAPTIPQQKTTACPRPRIAPVEVLFDRPRRDEHRDALDALAELGHLADHRC